MTHIQDYILNMKLLSQQAKRSLHFTYLSQTPGDLVKTNPEFFLPVRGRWPDSALLEILRRKQP